MVHPHCQLGFPILRQCADVHRAVKEFWIVCLAKVEAHDVQDGDAMGISAHNLNLRSRLDFSFLDNGKVETASLTRQETLDHVVAVKSQSQFVTGHAGLGNHQNGRSDSQTVTDAKRVFRQPFCGEVLTELAPRERHLGQFLPPVLVVLGWIRVYGLLSPACTVRSACWSPARFSFLIFTGLCTGSLKIPVWTVIPFQMTSRGSPTLTEMTCTGVPLK